MASHAMYPIRAASRRISLVPRSTSLPAQCTARTLVTASKAKAYPTSSSTPPASTSKTPPPIPPRSYARAAPVARKPVPAVSGEPLPDAPPATAKGPVVQDAAAALSNTTPTTATNNNNNNNNNAPDNGDGKPIDWTSSYHGLGTSAFTPETSTVLQARLDPDDIEVKPDGIIYLPEIKYRRILNTAFGPGAWGLAPRGELMVQDRLVTREYALVVHGRFVAQARGEQQYFSEDGVSTAAEGCKSNALMRCCKDLGIASELWDPRFIRKFMKEHAVQQWVEHVTTKKKKQIWLRKDDEVRYPFKKS
ncbi:mitochondrial genome maintenance MGM101 [Nemania sp. FL0031]|nr:mitochondrial genome maintenance MGM101 [Nemania sp. FL0031]